MDCWTIYERPDDYRAGFVVRRLRVTPGDPEPIPTGEKWLGRTLDEARAVVPPGLVCVLRDPSDPPSVVETWL